MKKTLAVLLILLSMTGFAFANGAQDGAASGDVTIELWTKEGEADGYFQYLSENLDAFMAENPGIEVVLSNKEVESLREDFQTAALANASPDLLWTVSDHAGPFVTADLIQPVDDFVNMDDFVESVVVNGSSYAVPISSGNHLMLIYNKSLVSEAPTTTDEFLEMAQAVTTDEVYGLVYNMTEPFWLVPWLGGFDGKVFEADGVTPSLDTDEMEATLQFLYDLKFTYGVTPSECDYNAADTLFKEGKAAMLINGDWSLGAYEEALGDDLGVTRIPMVSSTNEWPAPYTAGVYFMVPKDLDPAKADAVKKIIAYFSSKEFQYSQVDEFNRLPGLLSAYDAPKIEESSILVGSAYQLTVGTPQPTVLEMRAVWDAMKPEMAAVLSGSETPAEARVRMQDAAVAGIASQQ